MNLSEFRKAYIEEMNNLFIIGPLDPLEVEGRVDKMIVNVKTELRPVDWFRGNLAMKAAAKRFGFKTSKAFREALKALCNNNIEYFELVENLK